MEQWILVAMAGLQDDFFVRNYCAVKNSPTKMHSMITEQQLNLMSPYWEMPNIEVIAELLIKNKKQTTKSKPILRDQGSGVFSH